ncbi:MAG: pilus assembly protein [Gammaproteobacteria bacterium]
MKSNFLTFTLRKSYIAVPVAVCVTLSSPAQAQDGGPGNLLQIPPVPLFLGDIGTPNVFFTLDDSGSMDFDMLTRSHWDYRAYDPDPRRRDAFNSRNAGERRLGNWFSHEFDGGDSFREFSYLFQNTGDAYQIGCDSSGDDQDKSQTEACIDPLSPLDLDWRILSPGLNQVYYNPDLNYVPWKGPCKTDGTRCDDANLLLTHTTFAQARANPREGTTGYEKFRPLATEGYPGSGGGPFRYEIWIDDKGYEGDRPRRGRSYNDTVGANDEVDLWDSHIRIAIGTTVTVTQFSYAPDETGRLRSRGGGGDDDDDGGGGDDDDDGGGDDDDDGGGDDDDDDDGGDEDARRTSASLGEQKTESAPFGGAACYRALGPRSEVRKIIEEGLDPGATAAPDSGLCRTIAQAQQNIANWYTYARRRAYVAKGAISEVLVREASFRYGLTVLNGFDTLFTEVPAADERDLPGRNKELLSALYGYEWPPAPTPLRDALQRTGEYFAADGSEVVSSTRGANFGKSSSPIINECQKNFNLLFTDGFYNQRHDGFGDEDGDGFSPTLADLAKRYYEKDLDPGMDDAVVADSFDTVTHQHLNTFGVAFGVAGTLRDTDSDGWPNPGGRDGCRLNEEGQTVCGSGDTQQIAGSAGGWGNPIGGPTEDPAKIDDLWHAAYNSRGSFATASTPADLTEKLLEAINQIEERTSTASATSQSSARLNTAARIFSASFDSADWSGSVLALRLSDGSGGAPCTADARIGSVCGEEWDAGDLLRNRGASTRNMITYKPGDRSSQVDTPEGLPFTADAITPEQLDLLDVDGDDRGAERLNYLRGDAANEGPGLRDFRQRGGAKLGDVVNSDIISVGPPAFFIPDDLEGADNRYSSFRQDYAERTPVVYVGVNDGALHGFNAETGEEIIAYVPNALFPKLALLSSQDYVRRHTFFVDGDPTFGDAFFTAPGDTDGDWHTVVVGTLGRGGQGVFALNVTNPGNVDGADDPLLEEANANEIVLWEFTDRNAETSAGVADADLGFIPGRASILRMNNGKWAAVFGNGYNSRAPVGLASDSGNAVLYILFLEGPGSDGVWVEGAEYIKIDTTEGSVNDPLGRRAGNPICPAGSDKPFCRDEGRNNGLAEITAIDVDRDLKVDVIYGGDLYGNMWRFWVKDENPDAWKNQSSVQKLFSAVSPEGQPQPITVRPTVGRHPADNSGVLVHFGTGKYLEISDNEVNVDENGVSVEPTQTIYALYDPLSVADLSTPPDPNAGVPPPRHTLELDRDATTPPTMLAQGIVLEDESGVVVSDDEDILWATPAPATQLETAGWSAGHQGWYLDLIAIDDDADPQTPAAGGFSNDGRRIAERPTIRSGNVFYTITNPGDSTCGGAGDSLLLSLEEGNGSSPNGSVFDINLDGVVSDEDLADGRVVAGVKFEGLSQIPSFVSQDNLALVNLYIGNSEELQEALIKENLGALGRQSWRQVR